MLWGNIKHIKAPSNLKYLLSRRGFGYMGWDANGYLTIWISWGKFLSCPFHCQTAKETWDPSNLSMFECGLSPNSVFLNVCHLYACSKNHFLDETIVLTFVELSWNLLNSHSITLIFSFLAWLLLRLSISLSYLFVTVFSLALLVLVHLSREK